MCRGHHRVCLGAHSGMCFRIQAIQSPRRYIVFISSLDLSWSHDPCLED